MRIDPRKMVLGMMPRSCRKCNSIQHVFFKSQDEFDKWDCPVCMQRIKPDDDPETSELPVSAQEDEVQPSE